MYAVRSNFSYKDRLNDSQYLLQLLQNVKFLVARKIFFGFQNILRKVFIYRGNALISLKIDLVHKRNT